jgi:hypothetical protein
MRDLRSSGVQTGLLIMVLLADFHIRRRGFRVHVVHFSTPARA